MKTKNIIFIAFILGLGLVSCQKAYLINGNRQVQSATRELSFFDKIANNGSFEVTIINDSTSRVVLTAESNLISHISTYVTNDGALVIESDESLINHEPMQLTVYTPQLRALELNGSGFIAANAFSSAIFSAVNNGSGSMSASISDCEDAYIRLDGSGGFDMQLNADVLEAKVYGSGSLQLRGEGQNSNMRTYGSGSINAFDFLHLSSEAVSEGSGSIHLYVTQSLIAKIYGSGSIYYAGNPPSVVTEDYGSGEVIKR